MKSLYFYILFLLCLNSKAQTNTLILQPGPTDGKDASLGYHVPYGTDNINYGSDALFKAFSILDNNNSVNLNRGLIEFDLSSIPSNANVISAKLSLYATGYVNNVLTGHMGNNIGVLRRVTSAWVEDTVTWNTSPSYTNVNEIIINPSTSYNQDYLNIDVKNLVIDILANPLSSFGFYFQLQDESPDKAFSFHSSDASDMTKRPKLVVEYELSSSNDTTICFQPDLSVGKDASLGYHYSYGTENVNYGSDVLLKTFSFVDNYGYSNKANALFEFDLSSLPAGTIISNASLSLYGAGYVNNILTGHMGNNSSKLQRVVSSWSEQTVTWNSSPNITNSNEVILPQSTTFNQDYLDIDVTNLTQDMIDNYTASHGFYLELVDNNPNNALVFHSSDNQDLNKAPKLCLTYPLSYSSISKTEQSTPISIYPNPFTETFTINVIHNGDIIVNLINYLGQKTSIQTNLLNDAAFITLSESLSPGAYIVEIITDKKTYHQVIIKN